MTTPDKKTTPKAQQATTGEAPAPKLPHERDEAGDNVDAEPRAVIKQAKADIDSGKQATDRSEATDAAYRKQKE